MADYNRMGEDNVFTQRGRDFITWFRFRSSFEKISIFLVSAFLLSFTVIISGLLIDKRTEHIKLEQCLFNEIKPFTRINVSQDFKTQDKISQTIMNNLDKNTINQHLKNLTSQYHPAGTEQNLKVMDYVAEMFKSYGLDKVEIEEYNVLLSYPDYKNPNTIKVHLGSDWDTISNGQSMPLGPSEALAQQHDPDAKLWWNAYAKNGVVVGTIVYGNYCSSIDLDIVVKTLNATDLTGKIVLCRYGYAWRGAKVFEAEKLKAAGVILYSDPADYGPPKASGGKEKPFPNSKYMPESGAQRGSLSQTDGDPLTPHLPAKNYVFREFNEEEVRQKLILPNIPVSPVSYGVARKIFENMKINGIVAPESAWGDLNVTYYTTSSAKFELNVRAKTERRLVRNVFGYIYGDEEQDRLILLSNHVDAWTYGSQDPNSGTAINLAMSQAIMSTVNSTGWRPRRTLLFCAWDAEEYGLVGSTEWVQQKRRILEQRAVAVLNVDTALTGSETLIVKSVPLLYRSIMNAAKKVPNPSGKDGPTVYDSWIQNSHKEMLPNQPEVPYMNVPSGGSDFKPFLQYIGVPVCDLRYDRKNGSGNYALYHTMYEIDWTVENLVDPNFEASLAIGRVWAETARQLSDSLVIPFNVSDYALRLTHYVEKLIVDFNGTKNIENLVENFPNVQHNLTNVVDRFQKQAVIFQKLIEEANSGRQVSLASVEKLNSRLVNLERNFITPRGIPGRPETRHVIFATSAENTYGAAVLAGIRDSLAKCQQNATDVEARKIFNLQITILQYTIESAIDSLTM